MTTTLRKFKWFWAWQDDKEEAWLEAMSNEGWHLTQMGLPGQYTFVAGEPRRYAYRLDFITTAKKQQGDYLQLFQDAGWEHIGEMGGWQYWRKEETAEGTLEIFTDVESKVEKYRRLLGYLVTIFPIWLIIFLNTTDYWVGIGLIVAVLQMALVVIYAYCIYRLSQRIQALKRL